MLVGLCCIAGDAPCADVLEVVFYDLERSKVCAVCLPCILDTVGVVLRVQGCVKSTKDVMKVRRLC